MNFPFEQKILNGKLLRTFSIDVESDELKWHQDQNDRKVTIIESGDWHFQMDDSLPIKLQNGQEFFIPKLVWHRVIKGKKDLVVCIEE